MAASCSKDAGRGPVPESPAPSEAVAAPSASPESTPTAPSQPATPEPAPVPPAVTPAPIAGQSSAPVVKPKTSNPKLDSRLDYTIQKELHPDQVKDLPGTRSTVAVEPDGKVTIDIDATVTRALLDRIAELGGEVVSQFPQYHAIRARMSLRGIESLAQEEAVRFMRPALKPMLNTRPGDMMLNQRVQGTPPR